MKVSLWQQFSSNHSAGFTILGRFETLEKAQEAEAIFKTLLEAIQEARGFDINAYEENFLSWPEHEAGQKYGIKWEQSIDWISDDLSEQIIRFENNVFVTTALQDTWRSSQPVLDLMKHFSQEVYLTGEMIHQVLLTRLECHYPDDQVGRQIVNEVRLYLQPDTIEFAIPPWEIHSPVLKAPYSVADSKEGVRREIMKAPFHQKVSREALQRMTQALYAYQQAMMEKRPVDVLAKNAAHALLALENEGYTFASSLGEDEIRTIMQHIGGLAYTSATGGKIERTGLVIRISVIDFFRTQYGLPAIIDYLKDKECTDINYSFLSLPYRAK